MAPVTCPSTQDAVVQFGQPYVLRLRAGSTRVVPARMLRLMPVSANSLSLPTATMKKKPGCGSASRTTALEERCNGIRRKTLEFLSG